ncbi:transglycosylase SLT domain-containing protein [Prescottella equi]|uniref:transglycosylase SLT domain-containing protein n=1 Tax=Rhodococcus hoagii TaxID=43767 RepID=UPI00257726CF|nr:transglycosylase SLT domain-containing protein [Prescottella equi]WJJ10374.1 transglycosylase SLT domain-containing protein [Prescottella equi]
MTTYLSADVGLRLVPVLDGFHTKASAKVKERPIDPVEVEVLPDLTGFGTALNAKLDLIEASFPVEVVPDVSGFGTELGKKLDLINAEIDVDVRPDMTGFAAVLNAQLSAITATLDVDIDVSGASFSAFVHGVQMRLDTAGLVAPVSLALNDAAYIAQIEWLTRERTQDVRIRTIGGLGGLGGGADGASSSLSGMAAKAGLVSAAVAGIGGAVGLAAGAIGGLAMGFAGLGAIALPAIGALTVGLRGVGDAFSALGDVQTTGPDIAKAVEAAQQRVETAERGVENAQRGAETAQRRLNDARKDAAARLRDMNDQLKNSALDEEAAVLAVERAEQRLAQTKKDRAAGKATNLDVKEADLAYRQAVAAMEDQRKEASLLAAETAAANQAGIEGSQEVLDAKQGVADATQAQADAERDLSNAMRDLADASQGGGVDKLAEAMAKLSPNAQAFVMAVHSMADEWTSLKHTVQDNLFEGLDTAIVDLGEKALPHLESGLAGVASAFNGIALGVMDTLGSDEFLGKLDTLFDAAAGFTAEMGPGIESLLTGIVDLGGAIEPVASQLGASFSGVFEQIGGTLSGLTESGAMTDLFAAFSVTLDGLGEGLSGVLTAFTVLGTEVLPSLGPLLTALGDALVSIAPALGELGASFGDALTELMPHLADFISALAEGLAPVMPVLGELLASLGEALTPLIPPLSQVLQIVGTALAEAIDALAPAIGPLGEAFASLVEALAPILPLIAELIEMVVSAFAPAFTTIFDAMAPVIEQLVVSLKPVFEQLRPVLEQVAAQLGGALADAIEQVAPILPTLIDGFTRIVTAILPFIPQLIQMSVDLLPKVIDLFTWLVENVLPPVVTAFEWLAKNVLPMVVSAMQNLAEQWGDKLTAIKNGLQDAKDFIGRAVDGIKGFFSGLATKVSEVWDGIVATVFKAVRKVGELLQMTPDIPLIDVDDRARELGNQIVSFADSKIQGRAEGGLAERSSSGLLSGPGTGTSDSILGLDQFGMPTVRVSAGEMVVNKQATDANYPLLAALNAGWVPPADLLAAMLPGLAGGGIVESMERVVGTRFPMLLQNGHAYSSYRDSPDHHGAGKAADFSNGGAAGTPEMQALANFIADNYLGQTLELIHSPFGRNIKNGQFVGDGMGYYGADLMAQHRNHVHWAVQAPVGEPGPAFTLSPTPAGMAAAPTSTDGLSPAVPDTGIYSTLGDTEDADDRRLPTLSELASDAAGETVTSTLDFFGLGDSVFADPNKSPYVRGYLAATAPAEEKNTADAGYLAPGTVAAEVVPTLSGPDTPKPIVFDQVAPTVNYNPSLGAEQWRPVVEQALTMMGSPLSNTNRTVAQIDIESSGNPNARNDWDINAQNGDPSIGLLQVIKSTFDSMVHPSLAGRGQTDPLANLTAGIGWAIHRYGGPEQIWPTRAGYRDGGWIYGAGTGTSDSVPIDASAGEFVVREARAQRWGPLLEAVNSGALDQMVSARAGRAAAGPVEVHQHFESINTFSEPAAVREYRRAAESASLSDALA